MLTQHKQFYQGLVILIIIKFLYSQIHVITWFNSIDNVSNVAWVFCQYVIRVNDVSSNYLRNVQIAIISERKPIVYE